MLYVTLETSTPTTSTIETNNALIVPKRSVSAITTSQMAGNGTVYTITFNYLAISNNMFYPY